MNNYIDNVYMPWNMDHTLTQEYFSYITVIYC
jgi:hypothetical protein